MYFSVIIPTYNPREYLPELLTSLTRNECVKEIEVVLSDDCSEESFDDIIDSFKVLNIKTIQNDKHYGFPRNGRENGAKVATGKWICFTDQDDYYVDNAFDKIKSYIEQNNIQNYFTSNFIRHVADTDEYTLYDGFCGWTHGKFYEKSFWDKYELGYDNLQYCEDVNLSTKTGCVLTSNYLEVKKMEEPVYIWNRRADSLSSDINSYFPKSMPDYVKGTIGVIIDYIEDHIYNKDVCDALTLKFIQTIYHIYFYCQNQNIFNDKKAILATAVEIQPIYDRFKKATDIDTNKILERTTTDLMGFYAQTRAEDYNQVTFFEEITFRDWLHTYIE